MNCLISWLTACIDVYQKCMGALKFVLFLNTLDDLMSVFVMFDGNNNARFKASQTDITCSRKYSLKLFIDDMNKFQDILFAITVMP